MSTFRTRFGLPGVISTIALVFAMTGGAFAAKYLITSTKQISPSVLKKLKGATGPAGAAGAAGPAGAKGDAGANGQAGAQGAQGPAGPKGEKGADGAKGKSVKVEEVDGSGFACETVGGAIVEEEGGTAVEVCSGEPGKPGDPWSVGGTLPKGATLTGTWAFDATEGVGTARASISFPIKLAELVEASHVIFLPKFGEDEEHCADSEGEIGTPGNPLAKEGYLCIYTGLLSGASFAKVTEPTGVVGGASRAGAIMFFNITGPVAHGQGAWAITAG